MKYHLKIGEEVATVSTGNKKAENHIQVETEEGQYDVGYRSAGDHRYVLYVNGRILEAFVVTDREGKQIFLNGRTFHVKDADRCQTFRKKKRT